MLPSILAKQLEKGIGDYIETTFPMTNAPFKGSTLIATDTGSGKTECFLYPILEYCYQHRGEPR